MITITQDEIDQAVLLGKSASYRLAYELAMDVKFGGNIGCCVCNLKVLWIYTTELSCIKAVNTESVPPVTDETNCMTQAKLKSLIGKINSLVTKVKLNTV